MKGSLSWVGSRAVYGVGEIGNAIMSLSCGEGEGFVMCLCWNWTVLLSRSLLVDLMWQQWVR